MIPTTNKARTNMKDPALHTQGVRRTVKVYGAVDPREEERRRRQPKGPIRRPHAERVETSVKENIA